MRPSFFHHLHPPTIPAAQSRLRYTLGAGGFSVFLVLVLIFTGALEMFYYVPTPEEAGPSIQVITYLVPYGALIRNMHFWAAQLLVCVAGVHLLRVIFTGSYAHHRRTNYLLGLCLFVIILFLDFTGYILRWDEGIRWALVAGSHLVKSIPLAGEWLYSLVMGGSAPGPATLIRFYAWHIFGLMLILAAIVTWHIFRVRRDGGIAAPPPQVRKAEQNTARITRFELVRREALAALAAIIVLLLLSALLPAPLEAPIQAENLAAADSSAPWFFLWVQQMLTWGDPFLFGVLIPLSILLLLAAMPYLTANPQPEELGRWFPRRGRTAQVVTALSGAAILALTCWAILSR